jgi:hypothetical protein
VNYIVAGDEHAVVAYTSRAERAGRQLLDRTVLAAAFRDGRQAEARVHPGDLYAVDEFLS